MEDGACLQHNLDHIKQWYDLWHMDLNQSKCGLLSITRNASPFHYLYKLSDVQVKTIEAQKDLGVLEMELPNAGSLFEGQQDAWLYSEISFRHSWPASSQVTLHVTTSQQPYILLAGVGS